CCTNNIPLNFAPIGIQILQDIRPLAFDVLRVAGRAFAGLAVKPPDCGVVVVSPSVHNAVPDVIVRQVLIPAVSSKGELQNAHSGKSEVVAKSLNIGSDDAKVFGDDRQFPERVAKCNEKLSARNINPLTSLGCFIASGYFPTRGEASKVIDAQNVNCLKRRSQPIDPPSKTRRAHRVPVVNRITPKLPRAAEVIRRNARDDYRTAVIVELEHLGMTPNIRRIV